MPPSGPPDAASLARPWVAGYPPGVPPDYRLPPVALPRFLDDAVRDFPDVDALVAGRLALDYATVRDRVAEIADVLASAGVSPGDRVLMALPNLAGLAIVYLAAWRRAAVAVPLDPDVDAARLGVVVADAKPAIAVVSRRVARLLADAVPTVPTVVVVDDDRWLMPSGSRFRRWARRPHLRSRRRGEGDLLGTIRIEDARRGPGPAVVTVTRPPEPDDLALLTYPDDAATAGGRVASTHANLVAAAFQARLWVPDIQAGGERLLSAEPVTAPTALVLSLLLGTLSAATVICLDQPDAGELARSIERHAPTLLALPSGRVGSLLAGGDAARRDLTSLRVVLVRGVPLDRQLAATLERRTGGGRVRTCFGLDGAALTHAQPVYGRSVPDALGLPVTGTIAAVVEPADLGKVCPTGRAGRLVVYGPQVVDGRLVTDELATMDADGVFHHVGDVRDAGRLVARASVWVSPRRIEEVLLDHPAVRRAGVVEGDRAGSLHAAVVCGRFHRPDADELLRFCRAHLDPPAVPDTVVLLDDLPVTEDGELARAELRTLLTGG